MPDVPAGPFTLYTLSVTTPLLASLGAATFSVCLESLQHRDCPGSRPGEEQGASNGAGELHTTALYICCLSIEHGIGIGLTAACKML